MAASTAFRQMSAAPGLPDEYEFLVDGHIDRETLQMAEATAWFWGVSPHRALIALGWLSPEHYLEALGSLLGLDVIDAEIDFAPLADFANGNTGDASAPNMGQGASGDSATLPASRSYGNIPGVLRLAGAETGAAPFFALDGLAHSPGELRTLLAQNGLGAGQVVLVPPAVLQRGFEQKMAPALLDGAINDLRRRSPELAAGTDIWLWQVLSLVAIVGLTLGGLVVSPAATVGTIGALMTVPFLCVVLLRLYALLGGLAWSKSSGGKSGELRADQLPDYSVLVPLYGETNVLPDLITALRALDYPAAKLDIILILESVDQQTQQAVAALDLPPQFRVVVVPDVQPRTKPKALNYALQLAHGAYVVVYDAEDLPEPDQLRRAAACFHNGPAELSCVQARLNIYNPGDSWLTGQFTIEYSALFDALLPALERLNVPIPLGGTSNHFPRALLEQLGGWDAFNVTEDADLGIRMARAGLKTSIITSTTYEEAPDGLRFWMRQRTRWLKGWMQTYLVHSRQPIKLLDDLGPWRFLGLNILMGGILVSALVHPLFYLAALSHFTFGELWTSPSSWLGEALWWAAGFNLAFGYAASMLLGALAVIRRGHWLLALHALAMPLYWLLISFAAYRALWQLARDPYKWEKTSHRRRRRGERG